MCSKHTLSTLILYRLLLCAFVPSQSGTSVCLRLLYIVCNFEHNIVSLIKILFSLVKITLFREMWLKLAQKGEVSKYLDTQEIAESFDIVSLFSFCSL